MASGGAPRAGAGAVQDAAPGPLLVTWATADGSTFSAVVTDATSLARINAAFPGDGNAGIPSGTLVAGDGGVNAPHAWHLEGVALADMTIELCDATATMIDEGLDYWLGTVGAFCPWSATVIAAEPAAVIPGEPTLPPVEATLPPVDPTAPAAETPTPFPPLCGVAATVTDPMLVTFETGTPGEGDTFGAILADPLSVALARHEAATGEDCGFPLGALVAGDGGVNAPHNWQLTDATYVEVSIEACSARASEVDANLDYWLGYGSYCPWSAQATAVEPLSSPAPTSTPPAPTAVVTATVTSSPPAPAPTAATTATATATGITGTIGVAGPVRALPNTGSGQGAGAGTAGGGALLGLAVAAIALGGGRRRAPGAPR